MGVLVAWTVLGLHQTIRGMQAWPAGSETDAVIGVPLAGAGDIEAIRALLSEASTAPPGGWLVIYPEQTDSLTSRYVQYQLAYLQYPQRVPVMQEPSAAGAMPAAGVITAPGAHPPQGFVPLASFRGFTSYTLPGR